MYVELTGARQAQLVLVESANGAGVVQAGPGTTRIRPIQLAARLTANERDAHLAFIATLGENALWRQYLEPAAPALDRTG